MKKIFLFCIATTLLLSCSPDSERLLPAPDIKGKLEDDIGNVNIEFRPTVDILFVVDSSGSMSSHQTNLASNINLFTQGIQNTKVLDYHIGVLDGGAYNNNMGQLSGSPMYIDKTTTNGLAALARNIMVGTNGNPTETVLEPIFSALTPPLVNGFNAGFYRDDAYLAIVFLTDAEDQGRVPPIQLTNHLINLKGTADKILAYGAIVPTGVEGCSRDGWNETPLKIEEFINYFGGIYYSLCDKDFGQKLSQIGDDLVRRIDLFIPLKTRPVLSTVKVTYGSLVLPNDMKKGWTYDPEKNGLRLGKEIDDGGNINARLKVFYVPAKED